MHLETLDKNTLIRFSEPSMMEYYSGIAEFTVQRVRHLEHQHFQMIQAYIWHAGSDSSLLLINRLTRGEMVDKDVLAIFQLDHDGSVDDLASEHINEGRDNFAATFTASYPGEDEVPYRVVYKRLASETFHGIEDKDEGGPYLSQALYETQDDSSFYLALVEWEKDWLTAWFGMELRKDHVEII